MTTSPVDHYTFGDRSHTALRLVPCLADHGSLTVEGHHSARQDDPPTLPLDLTTARRWIFWRPQPRADGHVDKLPVDPHTGQVFEENSGYQTDPTRWVSYDEAVASGRPLGFVLGDGYAGIDLDNCRHPTTGKIDDWALELMRAFDCYTEVSPSRTGIKAFLRGTLPPKPRGKKLGIELYDSHRFFTVTGDRVPGSPLTLPDRTDRLRELHTIIHGRDLVAICRVKGWTLRASRDRVYVTCFWAHEHSHPDGEKDASLQLDDEGHVIGFHCFHGSHAETKHLRDVYAFFKLAPDIGSFPLTETGDAECFASAYGARVRYDHRQARWLILEDASGIWIPDRIGHITELARDLIRDRQRQALTLTESERRQKVLAWTIKGESRSRLTNLLALAQDFTPIADDGCQWDQQPHLLGTPDGVIDLRSGTLRPAAPDERITMRTSVPYDPTATSDLWNQTLTAIFPDPDERTYLQTALGYSTTGAMNLDQWFLPHGPDGRNGKGTILGAVRTALGDYGLEIDAATFDRRKEAAPFNLAKLPGVRFVHCAEAGDTTMLHHDRIKQISGGDEVMAGDKHQRPFAFRPACKLWFSCNTRPRVSDESAAFWARVVVVLFAQSFRGREDTSIRDALRRDPHHQQAILRWIVEGAVRYYANDGLGVMPPAFVTATDEFQLENDRLADFFETECQIDANETVPAAVLWQTYREWAKLQGATPLGSKAFYRRVAARFERKKTRTGNVYVGVTVHPSPSPGF